MKRPDSTAGDSFDDLVEAFVDGDLPDADLEAFAAAMSANPTLRESVARAAAVRGALSEMKAPPCPPHVVPSVIAAARRDAVRSAIRRAFTLPFLADWRPVVAMASLLLVVVLAARVGRTPAVVPQTAEVDQALDQVKWTLALLSDVGDRTARVVREDVMEAHVVRPMALAIGHVFEPTPKPF